MKCKDCNYKHFEEYNCGNSVVPIVAKLLIESNLSEISVKEKYA